MSICPSIPTQAGASQPTDAAPLGTCTALPFAELEQWVSGPRLLEIVWDAKSRPSLQWLRKETKRRMMPHVRRGRLIFYRPRSVMEWFDQRESLTKQHEVVDIVWKPASLSWGKGYQKRNTSKRRWLFQLLTPHSGTGPSPDDIVVSEQERPDKTR